jgi:AcrR family transcriptional regulator
MSARPTQEERVNRSTESLLQAAVELFAERGYAAATPAAIAERAGYDRTMVRVRFGSKLGLFETLLRTRFQEPLLAPAYDTAHAGLDRAIRTSAALQKMVRDDPAFLRAVLMVAFESLGPVRELAPFFTSWLAAARATTTAMFRDGQADGSIRRSLGPSAAANAIVDQVIGMTFQWCLTPDSFDLEAKLAEMTAALRKQLASQ